MPVTRVRSSWVSGNLRFSDDGDREILKLGTSGSVAQLSFFGVALASRPTAYTQTYVTADKTHAAVTQLAAPAGGVGAAAGGWDTAANRDLAITSINAARDDIADVKQLVNAVIDDLQALGLFQ